jgi:colanic acid biosynthesis glycosyl transferase WcaI
VIVIEISNGLEIRFKSSVYYYFQHAIGSCANRFPRWYRKSIENHGYLNSASQIPGNRKFAGDTPSTSDEISSLWQVRIWNAIQDATVTDWQQQIILISPFFHPELISTGKANQHLAEACAEEGHGVTVICSHPIYPAWRPVPSQGRIHGLKILRGGAWVRYPKAMPLRRLVLELWFALYAGRRTWRLRKRAEVVISVLPPSLFALFVHAIVPKRVRRVAVIHDLQGLLAAQEKSVPRKLIVRLIHAVESRAFRSQDLCIFFSGDMAAAARESYGLDPVRIAVQYPFITLRQDLGAREHAKTAHRLVAMLPPERLHVVYSGALGYKQNSEELVAFMQKAAECNPDVDFHIFSGGPLFEELRDRYETLGEPGVQFHPLVSERDLGEMYARSTIQIIPQAEGTETAALPSKLPNLLAAGVHLLAICGEDSEVGRLIRQAGTGTVVSRWDLDLFLDNLEDALRIAQSESSSQRRARVAPLLPEFSVGNMVRLAVGEQPRPRLVPSSLDEADRGFTQSGARG